MKKKKILLCNDDGINAPGIYNLWESLHDHAEIVIVAPAYDQSCKGLGVSVPPSGYIEADKVNWGKGIEAWKVFGTPADCIKFALNYLLQETPDLIISGINNGNNAGRNIIYSGTIGAVIQGTFNNVPGIALSCMHDYDDKKFKKIQKFIPDILSHFTINPIPIGTLMNINFPLQNEKINGFRFTKQGKSFWNAKIGSDSSLKGTNKYPVIDNWDLHQEEEGSDIYLLSQGFITCTPIYVNDLTDYKYHNAYNTSFNELNQEIFI